MKKLPALTGILPRITAFLRRHALALACALLAALLAAGGYSAWSYYQYRQSPEYAYLSFQGALHPADPEKLAELVDFSSLADDLAKAIAPQYPFLKEGSDQQRELSAAVQAALLKQARTREEAPKEEEDPQARLKMPLYALPPDLLAQVAQSLSLKLADADSALLTATVRHALLDEKFALHLLMEKTQDGWKIRRLGNSGDLAQQYRAAQMKRMQARRQQVVDKNTITERRMAESFPLLECQAHAGLISDGKTLLLVVRVRARNQGTAAVNNMNLSASLETPDGKPLLHRYLNAVQPTQPGEEMERSWTIELDSQQEPGAGVLAAQGIQCRASWKTLGLASGEVLHTADTPDLLEEFR